MRNIGKKYLIILRSLLPVLGFFFFSLSLSGQTVGVVLSGGGSSAIAHLGVLKALEENNIPIDYIAGTSMGALIGALYAAGYSPNEIEEYITSGHFEEIAYGDMDEEYKFFFKQRDLDPSFFGIHFDPDKPLRNSIPTHVYDSRYFDFEMFAILAPAEMASGYNFDSLFVPFRCVASDIYHKIPKVFSSGYLNQAVRASMTYPFYFNPITVDSVLYFDGGLYDNFPKDIMENQFHPDIIIGSNVSSNPGPPKADDLFSQLENMLSQKSEYNIEPEKGIIINMKIDIGTFEFTKAKQAIAYGFQETVKTLDQIQSCISRRIPQDSLNLKRAEFNAKKKELNFNPDITVSGIGKKQEKFIKANFQQFKDKTDLEYTRIKYFKVYSDDKVSFIFPTARYDSLSGRYTLNLDIMKAKNLELILGGILSSAPINTGYVAIKYNIMKNLGWTIKGNLFFGKFYQSGLLSTTLEVPLRIPFYFEPFISVNKYDYFKNRVSVFDKTQPPFIITKEFYTGGKFGLSFIVKSILSLDYKYFRDEFLYYTNPEFELKDSSDVTKFNGHTVGFNLEKFNQDYKQYASRGSHIQLNIRYVNGIEDTRYSLSPEEVIQVSGRRQWIAAQMKFEGFPVSTKYYSLGMSFHANLSNIPDFSNYFGTLIAYNAYQPIPEMPTIFQPNFRAANWFGMGLRNVFMPIKRLQLRVEGFMFVPAFHITSDADGQAKKGELFEEQYFILATAVVYHTRIGPVSLNFNYYKDNFPEKSFNINFGYTLTNKKAWKH